MNEKLSPIFIYFFSILFAFNKNVHLNYLVVIPIFSYFVLFVYKDLPLRIIHFRLDLKL